ncbi:MAG TPA: D-tagatose-bisphosphate aldolase, class II, non-catalytic subunit [Terracidiphilus sp.]|nr:D-tagatose-bisphosphate aldolase, class II, non-catalytic subunit [Terracidiphilus sp.]
MSSVLEQLAASWHRGQPKGMYSVCSAHPWVLEAAIDQALEDGSHLLIEATSNQVNHQGGYTGMHPGVFRGLVAGIAAAKGFDESRLILGGDHLGPNPWQKQPAAEAMREAVRMVQAYAQAGFKKIHLDASMACGDEQGPLSDETIAGRAAELCAAAEEASGNEKPVYVVGTEVPVPGGATESLTHMRPTSREAAARTLSIHRRIFQEKGLGQVWRRVIALVVQPGVEFNHDSVIDYDPAGAAHLVELLKEEKGLVYEAHSTDYQRPESYRNLVRDGFAILKVGPALTFAMREALEALSSIEAELVEPERRSRLMDVLERVMLEDRRHWEHHYSGDEQARRLQRRYSYSDRVRYYWTNPQVREAVERLMENLRARTIPETMLSAFLPEQYFAVRAGTLPADAHAIILHRIRTVLRMYAEACDT